MRAGCLLFFFLSLCSVAASGQSILFKTVFGSEPVRWNHQEYRSSNGERIRFSDFSFYLSEFSWYQGSEKAIHEHQRVELLRADAGKDTMRISGPLKSDRICFRFGLDSATQVSGRTDGALDPALGMYWAWNTGYIQCRLEGYSPESKGKKGKFEFHLGGYATPFSTSFKMCIDLSSGAENPVIQVNLKPLMDAVSLNRKWSVLTPGAEAWELSRLIGNSFQSAGVK